LAGEIGELLAPATGRPTLARVLSEAGFGGAVAPALNVDAVLAILDAPAAADGQRAEQLVAAVGDAIRATCAVVDPELIVLGGPMGVDEEDSFPFLRWEKRIIRAAIDESVPVLGICLGAQLIASTLGAQVFHGPVKEIGWSPISITPHGQVDSLLGYLPENATVFQWHGDGFDLPAGAICLASSAH